jgi:peptidoglycan/LPS O-acetylase OafA/YrhL
MDGRRKRITYLDGLRGVAILSVVAWHYTNWGYERFFPYGSIYAAIPVLDHGWVGVNIFFLISGYVILMTLERCSGFAEFMARRWLRLFPAMLIASLAIFAISRGLGTYMPHGRPDAVNLLPGLTFLIPTFWQAILQVPVDELDGVFWTLYVEMGFYVVFGLLYFRLGWRRALLAFAGIWLTVLAAAQLAKTLELARLGQWIEVVQWFGTAYFGWFVSGALFLKSDAAGSRLLFGAAMLAGLFSAFTSGLWQPDDLLSCLYLAGCVLFFAAAQKSTALQGLLSTRFLLFAGAISYPLYLLHNEIGIGLIAASRAVLPAWLWPALPALMLGLMLAAAWAMTRWPERWLARSLRGRILSPAKTAKPSAPA